MSDTTNGKTTMTRRSVLKWGAGGAAGALAATYLPAGAAVANPQPGTPISAPLVHRDARVSVWRASAMDRVYPDDPITTVGESELTVAAAGNETEAFQLVVRPTSAWNGFSLTFSDLHGPGGSIPASHVRRSRVSYVQVDAPSGPISLGAGPHPDPLEELPSWDLDADSNHAVWLSVAVPADTPAGTYHGVVTFWRAGRKALALPLSVSVYAFSLPDRPSLETMAWFQNGEIPAGPRATRIDQFDPAADGQDYRGYYDALAGHRINGSNFVKAMGVTDGNPPTLDTADFDRVASVMFDEMEFQYSLFPGLTLFIAKDGHYLSENSTWIGMKVFANANADLTPEFRSKFQGRIRAIAAHLKTRGWLDRTYLKVVDEVGTEDEFTQKGLINVLGLAKEADPDIPVVLTSVPHPDLYDLVDLWIPHMVYWAQPARAPYRGDSRAVIRAARDAGQIVWTYHNTIALIDLPSVRSRLLPWILWKEGFPGSMSWFAMNFWFEDPWAHAEYPGLAGAGLLVYPPRGALPPGTPVSCIRFELFRDGLEDYEYFTTLTADLALLRQQPPSQERDAAIQQGEQALADAESLIHGIPQVNPPVDAPYDPDPTAYEQARAEIAAAIARIRDELDT